MWTAVRRPFGLAAAAILSENSRKAPEHGTIALSGVNGPPLAKLFVTPGNLLRVIMLYLTIRSGRA